MLKTINLKKVYPNGEEALKGINLKIPNGQVVALIGPSGAGKSTFIRTINRLVEPTSGKVYFANEKNDITSLNKSKLRKIRRQIGMIFQEFALVERLSVMENVLSGRLGYVGFWNSFFRKFPQKDIEEAFRLLQRIGLEHMLDKRADELSGGQRQRVGIARALAQKPKVMLADEPVASLDPITSRVVMKYLKEINQELGITTIVNLHFLDLAKEFGERLIGLKDGELVYDGKVSDVSDKDFENIYGRAIKSSDLLGDDD